MTQTRHPVPIRLRPALRRLGLLALACLLTGAPGFAGQRDEPRDSRRAAVALDHLDGDVVEAALGVYLQGMTPELAEELVGRDGIATLRGLLADPTFARPDNVVALLACLDDGAATEDLLTYLRRPPTDGLSAEQDRALLLAPEALGHLAARGDLQALDALLDMTAPDSRGRALVSAARASDAPAATHRALLASALRGLARSSAAAGVDRLVALADGGPGPVTAGGSLVREARAALFLRRRIDAGLGAERSLETSQPRVHELGLGLDHANHASLTSPMTGYRLDALRELAASRFRREDSAARGSCCDEVLPELRSLTFGAAGDGLDVVDDETELRQVLADASARTKVVRAINWCGAPGTNIIACDWPAGQGTAVVRLSALSTEARVWAGR